MHTTSWSEFSAAIAVEDAVMQNGLLFGHQAKTALFCIVWGVLWRGRMEIEFSNKFDWYLKCLFWSSYILSVKTSWLKWKPDWDSAADKYMKAGMYFCKILCNYVLITVTTSCTVRHSVLGLQELNLIELFWKVLITTCSQNEWPSV